MEPRLSWTIEKPMTLQNIAPPSKERQFTVNMILLIVERMLYLHDKYQKASY
jgi:hypothetical protein